VVFSQEGVVAPGVVLNTHHVIVHAVEPADALWC